MMLKTIGVFLMCAGAIAQVALAQENSASGLLNQLMTPTPAAVAPAKPEDPVPKASTPGERNALLVHPSKPVEKPTALVVPSVKVSEVSVPPSPVAPTPSAVTIPEGKAPEVSMPVVAQKPEGPAAAATNKPTVAIAHAKKRSGGTSFLSRATASTNAPQRETVITSEKIDYDNREGVILFDDNVYVDDPQFAMRSDRLLVFMEGTNDVSQVMAIGHVTFSNEMRSATCSKAVFTKKDGQVVMTGDVRMKSEGETAGEVQGQKVVIWVDDERVEVLEGARITLPPGTFKKAADKEKKDSQADKKKEENPQPK